MYYLNHNPRDEFFIAILSLFTCFVRWKGLKRFCWHKLKGFRSISLMLFFFLAKAIPCYYLYAYNRITKENIREAMPENAKSDDDATCRKLDSAWGKKSGSEKRIKRNKSVRERRRESLAERRSPPSQFSQDYKVLWQKQAGHAKATKSECKKKKHPHKRLAFARMNA